PAAVRDVFQTVEPSRWLIVFHEQAPLRQDHGTLVTEGAGRCDRWRLGGPPQGLQGKDCAFAPGALEACRKRASATVNGHPPSARLTVCELIRAAKVGQCNVLMPYDDDHHPRHSTPVEPAVAKHMIPINLARLPSSEAIYTSFADNVGSASAIICGRHAAQP